MFYIFTNVYFFFLLNKRYSLYSWLYPCSYTKLAINRIAIIKIKHIIINEIV